MAAHLDYAFQESLGSAKDPSGKKMDLLLHKPLLMAQQVTLLLVQIVLISQVAASNNNPPGIESTHFFILANLIKGLSHQVQLS